MVEICNLRNTQPNKDYDFYIDRRSPVGNPFSMQTEVDRESVCEKYIRYFVDQIDIKDSEFVRYLDSMLLMLHRRNKLRLFCWCAPKQCHGETIKAWLLTQYEEKYGHK